MEQKKVRVIYDEEGTAVQVQMDFDLYQWLIDIVSAKSETPLAVAR